MFLFIFEMYESCNLKMQEICRICLKNDSEIIFCLGKNIEGVALAEIFQFISGIEVNITEICKYHFNNCFQFVDGDIANQICSKCNEDLVFASSIKRRILESDRYLRNFYLENESPSKIIEIDPIPDMGAITLLNVKTRSKIDNFSTSPKVNEKVLNGKSIKR